MTDGLDVRALGAADIPAALALNNTAEPHVPTVGEARFRWLLELASLAVGAYRGGDLLGLLIALSPRAAHDSPYYAWFDARYEAFLYIDRIVVGQAARGLGAGRALYAAAEGFQPRPPRLTCEVNELPPNPVSLAFHTALGFRPVGTVETSPSKKVVMLEKPLA